MNGSGLMLKKKKFIDWFLQTYRLKRPDATRLLDFIKQNDDILARTRFVENVRRLPDALIVSAADAVTVSFLCRLNGEYYEDINQIIMQLGCNPPEDLFVWLSFNREFLCSVCASVMTGEPGAGEKMFYYQVVREIEREVNINAFSREERKTRLLAEIDEALACGDRERFYTLAALFKKMFG